MPLHYYKLDIQIVDKRLAYESLDCEYTRSSEQQT